MDRDHYRCDKGEQGNGQSLLMEGSEAKVSSMTALRGLLRFLGHLVVATYGMDVAVFGICYPIAAMIDPQARIMDYFFVAPSFSVPILFGVLFGYRFGWRQVTWASRAVCLPPFALMAYALLINLQAGRHWSEVLARFFSAVCSGEECYFHFSRQFVITAPLMAALGYVVGSEFSRRNRNHIAGSAVSPRWTLGRVTSVGLVIVCLLVLSEVQSVAQKDIAIKFDWSEATGFNRASIEHLPESRLLRIVSALPNKSILLQTKPRIAYEMRSMKLKEAVGCVYPVTVPHLTIVMGLDHTSLNSCTIAAK
jgi:hypothetical protein